MPLEFDIPKSSLLAMLPIAPTSDVRHYLIGIAFDVRHDGCKLIATDGHRMLVQQMDCLSPEVVTDADNFVVIFPREFIFQLKVKTTGFSRLALAAIMRCVSGLSVRISNPPALAGGCLVKAYRNSRKNFCALKLARRSLIVTPKRLSLLVISP